MPRYPYWALHSGDPDDAPADRDAERLEWGACGDCAAPLWVSPDSQDPHCTPCHLQRRGYPPLPDPEHGAA